MSNEYNGKKRSELPDSVFGIPQERKYPMPDEKHTRSAIKLFNHVDPKYEEQLAKAVIKNMKKYEIDGSAVGPNNRLRKYLPKDMIKESAARPLIYTWERTNIPEYPVIQESSNKSDFSYSGIKTSAEKSEFKRDFREVFKEDPTESSINYMQMIKYKGSLVGYIGFSRYKEGKKKYLGIGNFMIIKRYQHSGIGSKVISDIIDRYKDNYDEIYCYVDKDNTNAIAFYKKIAKVNTDNLTKYGYYVILYSKSIGESSIEEGFLKSDKDIYYNKDKFDSGEINLCFITGHSGSGKSTMARSMQSNKVEHYELDDLNQNYKFTDNNLKEYGDLIYSFFKGPGKKYRYHSYDDMQNCTNPLDDSGDEFDKFVNRDFVKYAMKYAKSHKNTKFVIEGIWLYFFFKPEELKDYAVYIKGTSRVLSAFRAAKRDSKDADTKTKRFIYSIKGTLSTLINKYSIEGERLINNYRKYYENLQKVNESVSILPQDTGISTVIFDIGDVLVSANIKDYLMADSEIPNEIVDELLKLWFIDKDEVDDTMDLDTYREIVNKRMGVEFSKYIPKLFKYNVDCVTAFDYTIPMIQDLKDKGYKVYYLSNWSAWTHDLLQEAGKFDFLNLMDGGVFSYDVGYMKPDEEIYKILINKYKINPEEAVFFDDREENIEAANKLGIHGVHFPRHDSSIVYNSLKVMQIAHEIFNMSYSFKPCDMPEFITFSPKPALETVCMDIEIIPGASVTQDDDGSVKVKSYNKRYYDYDTVMQSFIEAAKREDFPISIKNGNDRFEYTPPTKEKPYGEVEGVSISKGGFTEETIQEELAKHSIAIENQHMVAKSSLNIIKPVIFNNDGYRKRAKDLNLKLRCDLLPVKGTTINIRVLDRYQICEDPGSAKQLLDDIKESCVTVANKLSGTFRYYVEEVTTDDKGCLNLHIKKMKVVSYNSDNEVMKEEDMEYPDFPVVLNIDSDITTVDIDKTLKESSIQEYGTTGGTIVGSNQPDSVYIVNYMQNNVFSGYKEPKRAICKKGMNQMYTTKNGKAIPVDIDKFKEEASDVSVFKFKGHPVLPYDKIIESASVDDDFYLLLTGDTPEYQGVLEYDNRFIKEENFLNALEAIVSCTESTITGQENVSKYPYMKVLTESVEGRCWNYYRDINGVFAMNELTRLRTASYDSIDQISDAELRLIERGTIYLGE